MHISILCIYAYKQTIYIFLLAYCIYYIPISILYILDTYKHTVYNILFYSQLDRLESDLISLSQPTDDTVSEILDLYHSKVSHLCYSLSH